MTAVAAITTAFIPVGDPRESARWYAEAFGLEIVEATEFSSVLGGSVGQVTLMGPASGIRVAPGLDWAAQIRATCSATRRAVCSSPRPTLTATRFSSPIGSVHDPAWGTSW